MGQLKDGYCVLSVSYDFLESGEHTVTSFCIPWVSVTKEDSSFSLNGEELQGIWTADNKKINNFLELQGLDGDGFGFDNVSVTGQISFYGNVSLDISGHIDGNSFGIKVLEASVDYPGSQANVTAVIDYIASDYMSFTNSSSSACDICLDFGRSISSQKKLHIGKGEKGEISFYNDLYRLTDENTELRIVFDGGGTSSIPGTDIAKMTEGSKVNVLKYLGNSYYWFLRLVKENSLFEPVSYRVKNYEISAPE